MLNFTRVLLIISLIFSVTPSQSSTIGETISDAVSSTGEFVGDVGKSAGIGVTAKEIDQDVTTALHKLLNGSTAAAELAKTAKAILVFPRILKAGVGVGGQYGNGALRQKGKTVAYYSIVAGSYGLQLGAQAFGYAMFFMDDTGLDYLLDNNAGWEVGVGPSIVLVDEGMAKTMNNTTITESVYVFTFSQHGLMAGAGIQGSKISKITP